MIDDHRMSQAESDLDALLDNLDVVSVRSKYSKEDALFAVSPNHKTKGQEPIKFVFEGDQYDSSTLRVVSTNPPSPKKVDAFA